MPPAAKRRRVNSDLNAPGPLYRPLLISYAATMPDSDHMVSTLSEARVRRLLVQLAEEDTTRLAWSVLVDAHVKANNESDEGGDSDEGDEDSESSEDEEEVESEEDEGSEGNDEDDTEEQLEEHNVHNEDFTIFEQCVSAVDYAIETKYQALSSSRQYDMADDVYRDILSSITRVERNVPQNASYVRKRQACYALIQIGHLVVASRGVIAREIVNLFSDDTRIPQLIMSILDTPNGLERRRIVEGSSIADGLVSLMRTARTYGCRSFNGLQSTLDML